MKTPEGSTGVTSAKMMGESMTSGEREENSISYWLVFSATSCHSTYVMSICLSTIGWPAVKSASGQRCKETIKRDESRQR